MNHPKNDQRPPKARRDELVIQELPDEVLVYDLKNHKAHCLNKTAAFVWDRCDGESSATVVAGLLAQEWNKPVDEAVVWLALKQLSQAGLLTESVSPNDEGIRVSRRAVLRKLGAAAAMTPLVISLVAPTAAMGASIPQACLTCIKKITGAIDCGVCANVNGACYDNSGCGNGQFNGCQQCAPCFNLHGGTTTVSWQAGQNGCV